MVIVKSKNRYKMWVLKISDVQIYIVRNNMVWVERMWCVNQRFGSIKFKPADPDLLDPDLLDPDLLDTDPPENAIKSKMAKRKIYQLCF